MTLTVHAHQSYFSGPMSAQSQSDDHRGVSRFVAQEPDRFVVITVYTFYAAQE